jgi:hypothetical protein
MKRHIPFGYVMGIALCAGGWMIEVPLRAQGIVDQIPPEIDISRGSGQSVQPFYEGWEHNKDGTISMWFGYLNRNSEEEVDVPVGPDNKFEPLGADQGQPTHFLTKPRRRMFVFKVNLPKDWDKDKKLVWTVTAHGKTSAAYGWMQREWEVDNGVREENGNGIVRGAPHYDPPNQPPVITGSAGKSVAVGQPLKLTASATDDGIPKPRKPSTVGPDGAPVAATAGRPQGLSIRWILYRAPDAGGQVTFSKPSTTPIYGQPVESQTDAIFTAPGVYWLQAIANDGSLDTMYNVKVTVTGQITAGGRL